MKKILCITAILCTLLFVFVCTSGADFGDFAGDYDYGGYDGGYDYDFDFDDDDDYDYGDDNDHVIFGGSSSSSEYKYTGFTSDHPYDGAYRLFDRSGTELFPAAVIAVRENESVTNVLAFLLIAVIVGCIVLVKKRTPAVKRQKTAAIRPQGAVRTDENKLSPMSEYLALDSNFSETALCEKLSNLYVKFQNAWQDKDLSELRPYLSDAFYATADRQLDSYRRKGQTNIIERIAVLGVELRGFYQSGDEDIIVAALRTRITDYVIDDKSGKVVRGSDTAEKFMEYEWILSRESGTLTENQDGFRTVSCPNCGAALNINKTAKCEYCGSIVTVDSRDWVVTEIKGISQTTKGR